MKKKKKEDKHHKNHKPSFLKHESPILKIPKSAGQKAADWLTKWAGSWIFIILFFIFLGIWMATNGIFVLKYFGGEIIDPYPFILLNLALSCLAAIQAPIILMSQNRSSQKDRLQSQYDYAVNRKAEKEIQEIKRLLIKRRRK